MEVMFTIEVGLKGDNPVSIEYSTVNEFLTDRGLKSLFDQELVMTCVVTQAGQRIAGIPFMSWERLKDAVISNIQTFLRRMGSC